MRGRTKLARKDIASIQRSEKEKLDKEAESLMQFIELPDFDVSEYVAK
jgi:hypothetical protein